MTLDVGVLSLTQRQAWLAEDAFLLPGFVAEDSLVISMQMMDDTAAQRKRCAQVEALVTHGTLQRRTHYVVRLSGEVAMCDIGFAEVLLVRAPVKPLEISSCRFCLAEEAEEGGGDTDDGEGCEEAMADAALAAAAAGTPLHIGIVGRLLRDVCACRGSAACVHEGCLVQWLASTGWAEPECPTCKQRFVG